MQLYAVRKIKGHKAVGLFYAEVTDLDALADFVARRVKTHECEYLVIAEPGGIVLIDAGITLGRRLPDSMPVINHIAPETHRLLFTDVLYDLTSRDVEGWRPLDPDQARWKRIEARWVAEDAAASGNKKPH